MQVTETLSQGLKHEFQVSVAAADLDAKADARLVDMKDKVRLNGFRPGKVPVAHLKKIYGRSVMAETIDQTIRDTNSQIFTERGFRLATEPKVTMPTEEKEIDNILAGQSDLTYTVSIEVVPPIALADFKSFTVEKPVAEVTDADVDEAIRRVAEQQPQLRRQGRGRQGRERRPRHRSLQGHHRRRAVRRRHRRRYPGRDRLQHLHSGLRGPAHRHWCRRDPNAEGHRSRRTMRTRSSRDRRPSSRPQRPRSKRRRTRSIDDEFAKTLGLESLDKLKQAMRDRLTGEFAAATRQRVKRTLLDKLDEAHRFEAPPSLIDEEFDLMWNSIKAEMDSSGKTFADENTTEEEAKEEYRSIADRRVRLGLVLSEIGDKNKITVTDDEVSRAVIERARSMPGREKEVWDFYRNNVNALAQLRAPIYEDKVVDFILELANVTEKKVSKEELFKEDEADKAA